MTGSTIAAVVTDWRITPRLVSNHTRPIILSEGAINRRISMLQRAWNRARDLWGWPLAHIAWGRLKGTEAEPVDRSVEYERRAAFLDALPARSRFLFLMGFHTGLRKGALLSLTAESFDWTDGIIEAWSKGRGPRGKYTPVPITDAVCAVIQAYGRMPAAGPIFGVTEQQLRRDIDAAAAAVGYRVTLHQTRHSFAQDLWDAGEEAAITDALHHSSPTTKKRYSHARIERLREWIERMQKQRSER